jgi:hypothetical protein
MAAIITLIFLFTTLKLIHYNYIYNILITFLKFTLAFISCLLVSLFVYYMHVYGVIPLYLLYYLNEIILIFIIIVFV